jgi:hypothetical protein
VVHLLLFLIKYGIITFFVAVIFIVLLALCGTILHYLYARKIYSLGDQFLYFSLRRQPEELYNLFSPSGKETTSLAEVVLMTETLHDYVDEGEKIIWHRTHIKKRRGRAIIHGAIYGKGKVRFYLVINATRGLSHRWYIQSISLKRDFSRSTDRSD